MQPLKIGISIRLYTPNSGGLQHHAAALVRHLRELGHKVTIVTRAVTRVPSYHDFFYFSESRSSFEAIDVDLKVLRHPRLLNPLMWFVLKCVGRPKLRSLGVKIYNATYARKIQGYFKDVDIIHHIGQGSEMVGFVAASAAHSLDVPFVVQPTIHPGQWGDSEIDFALYRIANKLLAHTNYEKCFFEKNGLSNSITVVGNGIDDRNDGNGERFRSEFNVKKPMILFVGRKDADKGYPMVLQAFARLRQKLKNVSLVCMGPGQTGSQGAEGVVEIGFAEEKTKHDALAACDLLCVPSEAESFGLIYMEAARYQKAILARRLPVLQELLGTEGAAILLGREGPLDNRIEISADELAEAMLRLLTNLDEQKRIGENAFRVSHRFLWPVIVRHFEQAYAEAL
jgi:glycosyltransferase involved in cell wall biosynthesis